MDVVGHQAIAKHAEAAAFSVLAEPFEVCAAGAVVAAFAPMLQLPIEQTDKEPAHDLILRDGVGSGRWVPTMCRFCHAVNRTQSRDRRQLGNC